MATLHAVDIANKLRRFIVTNKLGPDDRLPTHAELCRRLKIGPRPLREGLSILGQQGLIETRRKGGTIVKQPTLDVLSDPISLQLEETGYTYQDMLEARAAMESSIAAAAAKSRTAKDLLKMLTAIEEQEALGRHCIEAEKTDEAFHQAILAAAYNPVLLVFGQLIAQQFKYKVREGVRTSTKRYSATMAEHRAIYDSIEKKRPEAARKKMYEHVIRQIKEKK